MVLLNGYESENLLLDFDIFSVYFGFAEWNIIVRELRTCLGKRPSLNPLTASD